MANTRVYSPASLFTKKQKACKGRKRPSCKSAKRKCTWVNGSKRKYCRKTARRGRSSK